MRSKIALVIVCLVACGGTSKTETMQASKTGVETALVAVNAARDAYLDWSAQHQDELVNQAKTEAEATAAVASFRTKRQKVRQALITAYTAIATAASVLALFELGKISRDELLARVLEAVQAVMAFKTAIKDLEGGS